MKLGTTTSTLIFMYILLIAYRSPGNDILCDSKTRQSSLNPSTVPSPTCAEKSTRKDRDLYGGQPYFSEMPALRRKWLNINSRSRPASSTSSVSVSSTRSNGSPSSTNGISAYGSSVSPSSTASSASSSASLTSSPRSNSSASQPSLSGPASSSASLWARIFPVSTDPDIITPSTSSTPRNSSSASASASASRSILSSSVSSSASLTSSTPRSTSSSSFVSSLSSSHSLSRTISSSTSSFPPTTSVSRTSLSTQGLSTTPAPSTTQAPSTSTSTSFFVSTSTLSISTHIATDIPSASVFTSTFVRTSGGSTFTVVSTSTGVLGTGVASGSSFSHNVGGIVGVAIGGVVAVILGVALVFFACRRYKRRRGPQAGAAVELATSPRSPTEAPPTDAEHHPPPDAVSPDESSYHYTLRRPTMPPTPPSSSSVAGLLGRIRGGRTSQSSARPVRPRIAPGEFQGAAASPTSPPGTPNPPSSLLNPRLNLASSPPPEWVGWVPNTGQLPSPASLLNPAPTTDPGTPRAGLLRPSLAVLQSQSSRTLDDHQDYSRPIGGRVDARMESANTMENVSHDVET
ncbi:hypothetical protein DFH07DRAFT_943126 [Mycena maculata]|uniref:Transmembrane protein n=1 Tax=Mycena maculata TaxID=230809 RepID=A0AAD7N4E0_9AGAR|nr:hypothetical protein DFH07DRAFT_943126 [Mycena maculata]